MALVLWLFQSRRPSAPTPKSKYFNHVCPVVHVVYHHHCTTNSNPLFTITTLPHISPPHSASTLPPISLPYSTTASASISVSSNPTFSPFHFITTTTKPLLSPDNIWPPSQPQPVSVPLVLGSILALTTLTGILAVMIYHRQRNHPQVEAVPTAPPLSIKEEPTPEVSDSPKRVDPCNCARMEPRNCVLDHIVIYDVW